MVLLKFQGKLLKVFETTDNIGFANLSDIPEEIKEEYPLGVIESLTFGDIINTLSDGKEGVHILSVENISPISDISIDGTKVSTEGISEIKNSILAKIGEVDGGLKKSLEAATRECGSAYKKIKSDLPVSSSKANIEKP